MRKKREEELDALQSKLNELNTSIEHNEMEIKKSLAGLQQVCMSCYLIKAIQLDAGKESLTLCHNETLALW